MCQYPTKADKNASPEMSKNAVVEVEKTEKVNGNGHLFRPGRGRSRTVVVDAKDLARAVEHERNVQWKGVVRHE